MHQARLSVVVSALALAAAPILLVAAAACGGGDGAAAKKPVAPGAGAPTSAHVAEAKKTFETICFTCHGMQGRGDGPGSAALDPKPRDLGDPEWQKSVTDEHIRKVITMGGAAVGKSPMMPAQPQLKGTPVLEALVAHVRGLSRTN